MKESKIYGSNPELDKLVDDSDCRSRLTAANQGYGLDKLVSDTNRQVRIAVARQGYGLNILINDKEWYVRCIVAHQGYGLNILLKDEEKLVGEVADIILREYEESNLPYKEKVKQLKTLGYKLNY